MNAEHSVLVIDDEETVRESLASWLEEDGCEVDTAPDGPGGLALLRARRYAVLLVDLKMPGMDGLEVLRRARAIQPEVPFVIMTAYATVDTAVQAMKLGAYDYLVKPFEPEELSRLVARLTSAHAQRRPSSLGHDAGAAPGPASTPTDPDSAPGSGADGAAAESLRDVERKHIEGILKHHHWNISRSAKALGIDRVTLYNKIKRYQIREAE